MCLEVTSEEIAKLKHKRVSELACPNVKQH